MTDIETLTSSIAGLESKSAYARLKPLMPAIDRKIKEGVRRAEIHELLTAHGIEISAGSFYTYLWRYRKGNSGTAKTTQVGNSGTLPELGDVNVTQVDRDGGDAVVYEPSFEDLLSSPEAREKFADQFFTQPPRRFGKKK